MCRERLKDESGIALISVMLAVLILSGLVTIFVARSVTETTVSRHSRDREAAIHVAEASTDKQLAEMKACPPIDLSTKPAGCIKKGTAGDPDYVWATLDENLSTIEYKPSTYPSEEAWARALLGRMDGDDTVSPPVPRSTAWVETDVGTGFAVRPVDAAGMPMGMIFGVAASPSFDDPDARIRVVKLQVGQDLYSPKYAIMANGNLSFGGNAQVVAPNCDPLAPARDECNADIHVNDAFTSSGGSNTIEGRITVAGSTCPSTTATFGCQDSGDGVNSQPVPEIQARSFYGRELTNLNPDQGGQPMDWFDLCPDGTVRPVSTGGPCTNSSVIWPDPTTPEGSTTSFRGWKYKNTSGAVTWSATAIGAGVFYVHHADASINGSAGSVPRAVSVFVEQNPADVARTGSLAVSGNPNMEAAFPDVLVVTDTDLDLAGNATTSGCGVVPEAMSGFLSVREQFKTIGTVEIRGAVIVQDRADDHKRVQRSDEKVQGTMCLEYDENLDINIEGLYTITFWNEL